MQIIAEEPLLSRWKYVFRYHALKKQYFCILTILELISKEIKGA